MRRRLLGILMVKPRMLRLRLAIPKPRRGIHNQRRQCQRSDRLGVTLRDCHPLGMTAVSSEHLQRLTLIVSGCESEICPS